MTAAVRQAEVEAKDERKSDSVYLNLSLSLNLLRAGGIFQHPATVELLGCVGSTGTEWEAVPLSLGTIRR